MVFSKKIHRDPRLDKVFAELLPTLRAEYSAGLFGRPLHEVEAPPTLHQQLQQQLLECLHNCHQQIAFYTALERIYQERLSKLSQLTPCSPCNTSTKRNIK